MTTNKDNVVEGYTNQHVHHNGGHGSSHIFWGTSMSFRFPCSQCQWVSGCKDGDNVPLKWNIIGIKTSKLWSPSLNKPYLLCGLGTRILKFRCLRAEIWQNKIFRLVRFLSIHALSAPYITFWALVKCDFRWGNPFCTFFLII